MVNSEVLKGLYHIYGQNGVKVNEPMNNHTSFKVGGPADVLLVPESAGQLADTVRLLRESGVPVTVIGNGTNLIVKDKGVRGVVIKLSGGMKKVGETVFEKDTGYATVDVEAGILLSELAMIFLRRCLSGFEFAAGIPGTLGGAVAMNAGAYGGEISGIVERTQYLDNDCNISILTGNEHRFGKRTSKILEDKGIVIKATLRLKKGIENEIETRMKELSNKRACSQPLEKPSAGSVFKRPEGYFAGKLIEESGLKGFSAGDAQVSVKHCGFIVNNGNARAEDIIFLIEYIKQTVFKKFGVRLDTEVRIIGE